MDTSFIDVDFTQDPRYIPGYEGTGRNPLMEGKYAAYGDNAPMVDEKDWEELANGMDEDCTGLEWLVTRIFNQGQEGSCVGNASTQAMEIIDAKQRGKDRVIQLSPMSLYKQIGSGPMSGANIDDALRKMQELGILPLDTPENRKLFGEHVMPHTGFYNKYPPDWEKTAANFRVDEYLECKGVNEGISALFHRNPVVVGRDGHSICYLRPKFIQRRLHVMYVNSWDKWGGPCGTFQYGCGYDSIDVVRRALQWSFAIRSKVVPSRDFSLAQAI